MKGVDTTFIIDILRNDKGALVKAIELDNEPIVFTTEANVYEIVSGVWQQKINREKALHDMEVLLGRFTVLPLEHRGSLKAGEIAGMLSKQGRMIDDVDCMVAGILLANGCDTVVTRNVRHFERIESMKVESY